MIQLDTNYLIGLLVCGSSEAAKIDQWLAANEPLACSAIAWSEFLNGPVAVAEAVQVEAIIESRIIPFSQAEAALASDLLNKTGRRRGSRFDCMIAARAILNQSGLATVNQSDFKAFVTSGLNLV